MGTELLVYLVILVYDIIKYCTSTVLVPYHKFLEW